jgi:hypothetical protein
MRKALALLSPISPSQLSMQLEAWGYSIFEAVSLSEILHLCEHQDIAAVIVAADVDVYGVREALNRQIVIELTAHTRIEDLVSELTLLFGNDLIVQ